MVDIGDFFLWIGKSGGPVFMISLNPLTDADPRISSEVHLDAQAVYEFKIDLDGDAVADLSYKITVEGNVPTQKVTLRKARDAEAVSNIPRGRVVTEGESTAYSADTDTILYGENGERLFVGLRQDPFFFNFVGVTCPVADDLRFALSADHLPVAGSSDNTFSPTNISAIILEVPELKGRKFGAWAVTSRKGKAMDRCGRGSLTAIFLPRTPTGRNDAHYPYGALKQKFNETEPVNDRDNYREAFRYRLQQVQGDPELADLFLPDILMLDPSEEQAYPNGRNLREDLVFRMIAMINPFLFVPVGAGLPATSTLPLLEEFPYAGKPVSSYPYLRLSGRSHHHH